MMAMRGATSTSNGGPVMRRIAALAAVVLAFLLAFARPADALRAIDIGNDLDRIDITGLGEPVEGRGDVLQIETAPGADGVTGRMSVRASTPGTSPNWFVFALRNGTGKPVERWLLADRYTFVGSGIIWPELDGRRLDSVTPSIGLVPERLLFDGADAFRINLEPDQTITFAAELAGDRLPRMQLWRGLDYEKRNRNRQLFHGILLGITGLLAVFLTAVFAANHKAIFPSAALFTWVALAYLCVDFGFWHKLFNVRPEENAQYRAASEAAMVATLLVFLYIFLRLSHWRGFVRMLLGLWIGAQIVLIAVAFLDPRLAATFARLSAGALAGLGGLLVLALALRGQDRALSIVPTWMLLGVWVFGAALALSGRLGGEVVVNGLFAGLVLIVVLIGFTVTQYAFRSVDIFYSGKPDDLQLRSAAIDNTGAAVWEWNARRNEIRVDAVLEQELGLKPGTLNAKLERFAERMYPSDRERLTQALAGIADRGTGDLRLQFRLRHVDNSYRWFELEASARAGGDRRHVRCIGLLREITDAKRVEERLLHDAVHDSLTGLPNRALLVDRLQSALSRAASEPLVRPTVFVVDLDRFKSVNSSFGIAIGDGLLMTIGRRLAKLAEPSDTAGRIAGDQFALVFTRVLDQRERRMIAENIRAALKTPIDIRGQDIVPTASIGIAAHTGIGAQSAADLLGNAEIAMFRAKRMGPDQIVEFTFDMRADKDERLSVESDLRRAIDSRQLKVLYQPVMYLRTEEIAGFEALVRWEHPRLGMLNPVDFVPLAEESDLIVKLGSAVLQQAVADAQRWHKEFPRAQAPLFVSVNVSSRQLFRQDLVTEIRHIITRGLLPKGAIRLEVTESLVMENPELATAMLDSLAQAGAGLSLDDFGTGYSSLSYLNAFPFDTIKVDRALVHTSSASGSSSAILRSIVALAHELGKRVVAEGVETEQDVGLLRSIGCEHAQGFFYGEPIPQREVLQLLRSVRKEERRLRRGGLMRLRTRPSEEVADAAAAGAGGKRRKAAAPGSDAAPRTEATAAGSVRKGARLREGGIAGERVRVRPAPGSRADDVAASSTVMDPAAMNGAQVNRPAARGAARPHAGPAPLPLQARSNGVADAGAPKPPPVVPQPLAQPATANGHLPPLAAVPPPHTGAAEEASASLARLQAEMARPTRTPTMQPTLPPPIPEAQMPPPPPPPPMPDLSTLPPAIAESLARLAGVQSPPPRRTEGDAPPAPDGKGQT